MTLFKGCFMIKCNEDGEPPKNEVSVLYQAVDLSSMGQEYNGETDEMDKYVFVKLKEIK